MTNVNIIITNKALVYLTESLKLESNGGFDLGVYLSVIYPFTKYAHVNLTFCKTADIGNDDIVLNKEDISICIDRKSSDLLNNSIIDVKDSGLIINAPNLFYDKDIDNHDLRSRIKSLFENEINVILSQHGGFIELVDLINNSDLIIKFHGGCQGCGMVGHTLGNYIEKIIKKNFPGIQNIKDITSHDVKENAYY